MIVRLVLAAVLMVPVAAAAQVRDAAGAAPRGAGVISGIVRDDIGQPVRRAGVKLELDQGLPCTTITDADGRFSFSGLAAGRYVLSATKAAYLTARYGAARPNRPGAALVIAGGQSVQNADLILARGASIAGVIRGEDGEPLPGMPLVVLRRTFTEWGRVFMQTPLMLVGRGAVTDDRGAFRFYGLEPGEYVVSAVSQEGAYEAVVIRALTSADVDSADRLATGKPVAFAPIYFPGTPILSEAEPLAVDAGQERDGVDFRVRPVPTVNVDGVVRRADGVLPTRTSVRLTPVGDGPRPFRDRTSLASADGKFRFESVVPGEYVVAAVDAGGGFNNNDTAAVPIVVTESGAAEVSLVLRPGTTVAGRIAFDRLTQSRFAGATVSVRPVGKTAMVRGGMPNNTDVVAESTGEFRLVVTMPGSYVVTIAPLARPQAPRWSVSSIQMNGSDVTDTPFEISGNEARVEMVATLTDGTAGLRGQVLDSNGRPTSDLTIVLFTSDRRAWRWQSRRIKAMRPASDGSYNFADVPPGEYFLAAVTDVEPNQWFDSEFLNQIRPATLTVPIAEGEQKVQDIRVK